MTRAVLRYVRHRITRHPDVKPAISARCMHGDCTWTIEKAVTVEAADNACMRHTGRSSHGVFARTFEDVAVVVRDE